MSAIAEQDLRYRLSPLQQSMVLSSMRAPRSGLYLVQAVCTLREHLDVSSLKRAWQRVVDRHAALRSSIHFDQGDGFWQRVHPRVVSPWEEHDWSDLPPSSRDERLQEFLKADCTRGFELTDSILMRVNVFRMQDGEFVFVWTSHHGLLDGRSYLIILQELFAHYQAFLQNDDLELPESPPYRDHVEWLLGRDLTVDERFWREQLQGITEPTRVVVEAVENGKPHERQGYAKERVCVSPELNDSLIALARENGLTMNTVVQGAWALLLSRYSGTGDVVFGATRACRRSSVRGAENMVGLLINTVPVRVRTPPDARLLPWLRELREQWIAMREHEHTPLSRIHAWTGMSSGRSLFESIVVFEHRSWNTSLRSLGGPWQQRTVELRQRIDNPITLAAFAEPQLTLEIIYDRERFDDATPARMLGHLRTLLEGFVTHPEAPLSRLPLLTGPEKHRIIHEWNATERVYPGERCIHQLFEERVREAPGNVALVHGSRIVSYRELNRRANQLAACLRRNGVGPESFVGVCLDRSPEIAIGVLAVLKAGGAFLPLDPALPARRIADMLRDAGAGTVITRRQFVENLAGCPAHLLCVDDESRELVEGGDENPVSDVGPDNAAYTVFTSGSTGRPKGVVVTHRSLVNHTLSACEIYGITARDRRLQFASIGTDFFVAEISNYLVSGATLVFPSDQRATSILEFVQFISEQEITVVGMPSSYWNEWVVALSEDQVPLPSSLRLVITGMEKIRPEAFEIWKRKVGKRVTWCNAYGPTETTCTATIYTEDCSGSRQRSFVPIGRPIANTRVYVLDRDMNPVPVRVPGELYIGGAGVARGYLGRLDLTAERFVRNPFSDDPNDRLYRTGDLVFYLPEGDLVFLQRLDRQVKVRGFRVELDEIEATLNQHPAVRQCAVTVQGKQGDRWLAGYVTLDEDQSPSESDLRLFLSGRLPEYMIPSAFVVLDTMPLTPSGKLDRERLPTPERGGETSERFIEPRTRMERRLAVLWSETLNARRVGATDDFFALGGDSLGATRLISRVLSEFGVALSIRTIFDRPTLAGLANELERALDEDVGPSSSV